MRHHIRLATVTACAVVASGFSVVNSGIVAASSDDDGQVIVTPSDPLGRYSQPGVDMRVLESQGEAPASHGPGPPANGPDRQSGTKGRSDPSSALPPGCFIGGFGAGGGLHGPAGSAFGMRCMPPLPANSAPAAPAPAAPALPSPAGLAAQAFEQLRLPLPLPRHSPDVQLPDGRAATIVGENTWIWTDRGAWTSAVKRVQVGPVWAQVTAVPTRLTFDSGTGGSTSCDGPGTPFNGSFGLHSASPDCSFVYTRSSYGLSGDQVRAEWSITWAVSWTGSDGTAGVGGEFPQMLSRATATYAVAEIQALRARG